MADSQALLLCHRVRAESCEGRRTGEAVVVALHGGRGLQRAQHAGADRHVVHARQLKRLCNRHSFIGCFDRCFQRTESAIPDAKQPLHCLSAETCL